MLAFNSPTDRMMARVAIVIFSLGLLGGLYAVGPPLYWRFYATIIHPFEDNQPRTSTRVQAPVQKVDSVPKPVANEARQQGGVAKNGWTASAPTSVPSPATALQPAAVTDKNALTKELIQANSQDGYIMVTWANEHYLDFALSWVANLKRAGVTGYLVGAMDDDMHKQLTQRGIHTWNMNTGITKHDLGWGSKNFHKMGRSKIQLIQDVLGLTDLTVVVSDIDTAWLKNPIPFFDRFKDADILTSTDQLGPTVKTEDLERWPDAGSAFNIGIMVFRPKSKSFVHAWVQALAKEDYWDQSAFNDLVRKGAGNSDATGLFKGFEQQLTVGILPASQFASGHTFFVQRKYEEYGLQPYVAHATFQYSGTPGKRHRFREFMLFEDPPEYYDHPKGFVTFKVDIPQSLLDAAKGVQGSMTADKAANHFALVNHQLLYIRAGLALATLTGRAIILPPIWCELDKYWAPLFDGSIPGSHFRKPFICPMDHVLDIEGGWFPKRDEAIFGPHVEWREYSFLQNPRLSAAVNQSRVVIEVCGPGDIGCSDGKSPAEVQGGKVRLGPGLDSTKLSTALSNAASAKIWDVSNILQLWPTFREDGGWFTDTTQHARFVARLRHMTSVICCVQSNPGWIWYDFLWDVPHKDRHSRQYDSWHVKLGDGNKKAHSRAMLQADSSDSQWQFLQALEQAAMHSLP